MIKYNIGIVETRYGLWVISNKYQLFCTREQSAGGKWGGSYGMLVIKHVNNDTMKYEIKQKSMWG